MLVPHVGYCNTMLLSVDRQPLPSLAPGCNQLLLGAGLIRQSSAGIYHLLPLGMKVLERLVAVVDHHMQAIGGSKMALPILTPASQWKTSGILSVEKYLSSYYMCGVYIRMCVYKYKSH